MVKDKLLLYYVRLSKLGVKQELLIALQDVAEAMFTSTRHSRTLLKEMHAIGWLSWTPKVGRNQRSGLFLKYSPDELKTELAKEMISTGKYEKALALIDSNQRLFGQLLQSTSGATRREGQLHIQLTYRRPFAPLLPHTPLRNSERFFLRQVYCCLTRCDENGMITAQLAHHWSYDEQQYRWRFYLRPQLTFHDGSEIHAENIAELFCRLKELPGYEKELAHLTKVSAVHSHCIEFQLNQPDPGFAGLVADARYAIQPVAQLGSPPALSSATQLSSTTQLSSAIKIVGSGAFQIQEHSDKRLRLQAFDNYYGCRALTDTVTVWQVPAHENGTFGKTMLQADTTENQPSACSHYLSVKGGSHEADKGQHSRIEDGCLLMLISHQAQLSLLQRKYLAQVLTDEQLIAQLSRANHQIEAIPAHNLLPGWLKTFTATATQQSLPEKLTIALFQHQALLACSEAIAELLKQAGVSCRINVYSFEEFYQKTEENGLIEDLILTSLNLDDNRPTSAFRWLLSNPVLHQCLPAGTGNWLEKQLTRIRQQSPLTEYLNQLEPIATAMISEHWLLPLFHHRQTLRFEGILKGVSITPWGWPAIQDVWSED